MLFLKCFELLRHQSYGSYLSPSKSKFNHNNKSVIIDHCYDITLVTGEIISVIIIDDEILTFSVDENNTVD